MKKLTSSAIIRTALSGDFTFSARKISAKPFNGLMDPILGFEHFQLTDDVFGPYTQASVSAISYLFDDSVAVNHVDSMGTDITINPGSLLWTWAGQGVEHTEFPIPSGGRAHGLQVFINMPSYRKEGPPQHLYIDRSQIPESSENGVTIRVVTGRKEHLVNPAQTPEPMTCLHVFMEASKTFTHRLPGEWTATIYILHGVITFDNTAHQFQLDSGSVVAIGLSEQEEKLLFTASEASELIFLSGLPLQETSISAGSSSHALARS